MLAVHVALHWCFIYKNEILNYVFTSVETCWPVTLPVLLSFLTTFFFYIHIQEMLWFPVYAALRIIYVKMSGCSLVNGELCIPTWPGKQWSHHRMQGMCAQWSVLSIVCIATKRFLHLWLDELLSLLKKV